MPIMKQSAFSKFSRRRKASSTGINDAYELIELQSRTGGTGKHPQSSKSAALLNSALFALLCLTLLVPGIALMCWTLIALREKSFNLLHSAPIGGSFSQMQAKAVDFVCGAILAPLIMASINFTWFWFVRLVVYNELSSKEGNAVPLTSMLELSITSSGSYSLYKLWTIIRASRTRFVLVAVVIFLSALSTSFLVNVIAYEAFQSVESFNIHPNNSLQYLWDPQLHDYSQYEMTNFSAETLSILSQRSVEMLHTVALGRFVNGSGQAWGFSNDSFISVNATSSSLERVDNSVRHLWNVPAYRKTITCVPIDIGNFSAEPWMYGGVNISSIVKIGSNQTSSHVKSAPHGSFDKFESMMCDPQNWTIPFMLYQSRDTINVLDDSKVILAVLDPNLDINKKESMLTDFGSVPFKSVWFSEVVPRPHKCPGEVDPTIYAYGIACDIHNQRGIANLTASDDATRKWIISNATFGGEVSVSINPFIRLETFVNYRQPVIAADQSRVATNAWRTVVDRGFDAIGQAIGERAMGHGLEGDENSTAPVDFNTYASSLLYASAQLESIVHDVALSDPSLANTGTTYPISGTQAVLKYRMAYIPAILVAGLLSLIIAAAIVVGITLYSWNAPSFWENRVVDGIRFITDFAAVSRKDEMLKEADKWNRKQLDEWRDSAKLRYTLDDDDGRILLKQETASTTSRRPLLKRLSSTFLDAQSRDNDGEDPLIVGTGSSDRDEHRLRRDTASTISRSSLAERLSPTFSRRQSQGDNGEHTTTTYTENYRHVQI